MPTAEAMGKEGRRGSGKEEKGVEGEVKKRAGEQGDKRGGGKGRKTERRQLSVRAALRRGEKGTAAASPEM